jgi:hypothetical protein
VEKEEIIKYIKPNIFKPLKDMVVNAVMKIQLAFQQYSRNFDTSGCKIGLLHNLQLKFISTVLQEKNIIVVLMTLRIMPFLNHQLCTQSMLECKSLQS